MEPIIVDLLKFLQENLPPDIDEESLMKNVRKLDKIVSLLIGISFEEFQERIPKDTISANGADDKLKEMVEYVNLSEEKQVKTKKLEASRSKLELKKEQYQLITSIRLDRCMDLISRYNHLMSKK